jgi:dTDP-glucose 4,6-dehydratase
MKNVLVTGGAGFIGSNFVRMLLERQPDVHVVNLDLLAHAGLEQNISDLAGDSRHTFVRGDVCDASLVTRLMTDHKIGTVVHFAAETHVDRSIAYPANFVLTNVLGTQTMLEVVREAWRGNLAGKRFHQVSTDEVYGDFDGDESGAGGSTELSPYRPRSPYASSKAGADHLVRAYFHTYGLPVTISLSSNNYGPHQFPEKLIPFSILCALEGRPVPLYGDGRQVRDWIHVLDHCECIYEILTRGRPGESYNIATGTQLSNLEVVQKLFGIFEEVIPAGSSYSREIEYVSDRPGHDRRYAIDTTKVQKDFGWRPRYDIDTGLRLVVRWYLEHGDWLAAAVQNDQYKRWFETNYGNRPRLLHGKSP